MVEDKKAWVDIEDEQEQLPPKHETEPDKRGIKTVTSYKHNNNGQLVKMVQQFKVTKKINKVHKGIEERKKWTRYGEAKGTEGTEAGVTSVSEPIYIEFVQKKETATGSNKPQIPQNIVSLINRQKEEAEAREREEREKKHPSKEEETTEKQGPSRYVPPSLKSGGEPRGASYGGRDWPTVRVTNLSENVTEEALKLVFNTVGDIRRIYLAKDDLGIPRGFAFVSYFTEEQAEKAITYLNGYGLDHFMLKVERAKRD
eukprot:gb/GECH01012224.1/.p1 GENE.gb/GECH01012224.1/~~gb/GECH01012224.1/.p1  ORF type:complete len:257 (+),score=75.08 gb/GECH01012224.1/:1-771(+)